MGEFEGEIGGYDTASDYISANQQLYNRLAYKNSIDHANRVARCREKGWVPETDLELVLNSALVEFSRANVSKKYVPAIAAMRIALQKEDALSGTNKTKMTNIRKVFDKTVKSKFYGETVVDENLQPILKFLNMFKGVFTDLTLSLNTRSLVRESIQGVVNGMMRSGAKLYSGINEKDYVEGLTYVMKDCMKNFSGVSLLQQMNATYGMANQSLSQVSNQRRLN